jgi:simple sugar transport system substrate-binding protein
MNRRNMRWGALALAFALILAACGGDEAETTTTAGETTTTAAGETTTTAAGETTTTAAGDTTTTAAAAEPITFGMILVGPQDDRGWSQAHREAGEYVKELTGSEMIVIDKVNPADRPDTPFTQIVDDMIDQGAQLIFATSDDMKDGILEAAAQHPDVPMIWSSGDSAWEEGEAPAGLANLGNVMGEMEYGKMMAGCAAALKTETGSIGYLGPLINDETRRLVNAAFLGAQYCWENYRGNDPADLAFAVNWIGFWFQIPGVTLDPTQVTNEFLDGGADVVISGIDTTEAIVRTGQRAAGGEAVWAVPYDYEGACAEAPEVCLGVPYFNWGPAYLDVVESVQNGTFEATWEWVGPDWNDINNHDTSAVGFVEGDGLGDAKTDLDAFIAELAGGLELWTGPLNYQDGSTFLADGETATDQQIWYMPQLLEGVEGASEAEG